MGNYFYYYTLFEKNGRFASVYRGDKENNTNIIRLINFKIDNDWITKNKIQVHEIFEHFSSDKIIICKSNCVDSSISLLNRIIKDKGISIPYDKELELENASQIIIEKNTISKYWSDNDLENWYLKINEEIIPVEMDETMKMKIKKRIIYDINEIYHP